MAAPMSHEEVNDLLATQLERDRHPRVADRGLDRLTFHRRVEVGAMPIAPEPIDRTVPDDRADPGAQRSATLLERRSPPPDRQECLLDHVLGRSSIAQDAQRDGMSETTVSVVQGFDPLGRMGRDRADNVVVSKVHSCSDTRSGAARLLVRRGPVGWITPARARSSVPGHAGPLLTKL